ncbi:MAG: tetraacyldisaccharide 4'-kinase [Candidatus Krumholzibacteriia bacterium]
MKVIDLRPWPVRAWERLGRTDRDDGGPAGRLAARAADALARRRAGGRGAPPPGLAVVSVGNLAFGGTGKTPVVAALARDLAAAGRRGAVLTRGYGSRLSGLTEVAPGDPRAGDEARLLATRLAPLGWPVFQARRRGAALAQLASRLPGGSVVILEDGHQTARAGRHLDVLILDRWSVAADPAGPVLMPATGPVAPLGPWRESAAGALRAAVWLVEAERPPTAGAGGRAVAGFVRELMVAAPDGGPVAVPAAGWAALSGLARPAGFEQGAQAELGTAPVLCLRCADHARYEERLLARVAAILRRAGRPLAVTTQKDWVKLETIWPADLPVAVARLDVRWTGGRALPDLVGERLDAATGSAR